MTYYTIIKGLAKITPDLFDQIIAESTRVDDVPHDQYKVQAFYHHGSMIGATVRVKNTVKCYTDKSLKDVLIAQRQASKKTKQRWEPRSIA